MIISNAAYVKAFAGVFGVYGLQMLAVPSKMVTGESKPKGLCSERTTHNTKPMIRQHEHVDEI